MPRAEDNGGNVSSPEQTAPLTEPLDLGGSPLYGGNRDNLEYGQRHGLMEDERAVSGQKRICFCWGYTHAWCKHRFMPFCLVIMYPLVYLMGYYSGSISNRSGSN